MTSQLPSSVLAATLGGGELFEREGIYLPLSAAKLNKGGRRQQWNYTTRVKTDATSSFKFDSDDSNPER